MVQKAGVTVVSVGATHLSVRRTVQGIHADLVTSEGCKEFSVNWLSGKLPVNFCYAFVLFVCYLLLSLC